MMEDRVDGEIVLNTIFDVVDLNARQIHRQGAQNWERRLVSRMFDEHGKLHVMQEVRGVYFEMFQDQFPVHEQASLMAKLEEESYKEPADRVHDYKRMKARLAQLEAYDDEYAAACVAGNWAMCHQILVEAQPVA